VHRWLFAFVVSSSLGAQAPSPDVGIFRHREALTELTFRDTERRPVVSDELVDLIEREIEVGIGVPKNWRVELRRTDADGTREVRARLTQRDDAEILNAHLVGAAGRELGLAVSLDLCWVGLSGVVLLDERGATRFSREQTSSRADWFPLRSLPILLASLESELARGLPADCVVETVGLESAQPVGESPSVCAQVSFKDEATARSAYGARGVLRLPSTAAHPAGFAFTGSERGGDSVIGPVNDTTTFRDSLDHVLEIHDALAICTAWDVKVFPDAGLGGFWMRLSDRRPPPTSRYRLVIDARAASPEPGGSDPRFALGGVELSPRGLQAVLDALASEYDSACTAPLMVYGCRELREVHAIFCDVPLYGRCSGRAPALRLRIDEDSDSVRSVARLAVNSAHQVLASAYDQWTVEFADGCLTELWLPTPVMCSVGDLRMPHGTFGGHEIGIAGGLVQTRVFGR
jgi:hypothetical protein